MNGDMILSLLIFGHLRSSSAACRYADFHGRCHARRTIHISFSPPLQHPEQKYEGSQNLRLQDQRVMYSMQYQEMQSQNRVTKQGTIPSHKTAQVGLP